MKLREELKSELRKVFSEYEYEDGYTHIAVATDDPEKLVDATLSAILTALSKRVSNIKVDSFTHTCYAGQTHECHWCQKNGYNQALSDIIALMKEGKK